MDTYRIKMACGALSCLWVGSYLLLEYGLPMWAGFPTFVSLSAGATYFFAHMVAGRRDP